MHEEKRKREKKMPVTETGNGKSTKENGRDTGNTAGRECALAKDVVQYMI